MIRSRLAQRQRGYTLIEVIVAFGLLSFAMTMLLGSLTNATRQVKTSSEYGRAALHAQSLLDQAGVGEALTPGERDGELERGRYRWVMKVEPFRDPTSAPRVGQVLGAPQLMELELSVQWGDGGPRRTLVMKSLRLVTPTDINAAGVVP